ncbi:sensor histidine kinase [Deinococcus pimensis]|uniref:sensor histidine kinase n=1 Tax=Deinococcus pimensis TaxID=309888 RepID=UPI000485FEEE|nr:HAMP domain-containing sensor histidine kinase [Deinococcus pimensis]
MKRPFWRTLAWKLTLAFVLVAALALGAVGVISYASTRSEFNRFIGDQARNDLVNRVQTYVQENGNLAGFTPYRRNFNVDQGHGTTEGTPRSPDGRVFRDGPIFRASFVALDPQFRTLYATPTLPGGTRLPENLLGRVVPVTVDGNVVAYVAPSGVEPRLDPRSQEFLERTSSSILWGMLAATLAAVGTGLLMARALLGPLQELRRGIQAVQRGEAPREAPRARADEFGEVLHAFHEMHDSVVRNQQSRQQLTANIAHDLNTPLSVISGTLEAMIDGTFKATPERLARLHRETRHVAHLVNDLRFLSLADAGELHLDLQETDAALVLREAVSGVAELAGRQGVTLAVEAPEHGPLMTLDARRVTQVIQNLLSNALSHTPPGGRIDVVVRHEGTSLSVDVQDTGVGIAADKLPFVFDRLYRAEDARSEGGSGLGLSICKSIVEAHGGRIGIRSEPGRGTTVTFALPSVALATPQLTGL